MNLKKAKIDQSNKLVAKALRENADQLVANFLKGKEFSFLEQYSQVLDNYFRESFEMSRMVPELP